MKITLTILASLLMMATAYSQSSPDERLDEANKRLNAGNHREAADLAKTLLNPTEKMSDGTRAAALSYCVLGLRSVSEFNEAEEVIEKAVTDFGGSWVMLTRAASVMQDIPHYGSVVEGKFQRGEQRNQGERKETQLRDRVRVLQILEKAWSAVNRVEATSDNKAEVIDWLILALGDGTGRVAEAWKLQIPTDLSKLPDFDEEEGEDEPANGYPVNEKSEPVFFSAAATWETAKTDGGRLFWLLDQKERLGGQYVREALKRKADLLSGWFSVRTLAAQGWWGRANSDDAKSKAGIAAVHTLSDDETVAKLASGPKRFTLPEGQSFLRIYQRLAEDDKVPAEDRVKAWTRIAHELQDRRLYGRAADGFRKAIALNENVDLEKELVHQLSQIEDNLARLEPQPAQPAGKGAKLSLVFRNASQIRFTAREVNVLQLVEDTKAWLRAEPQDREDWWRGDVRSIGTRLLEKDQGKYLGKPVAEWVTALEPAADHWDKRIEISTPLQKGGAYFIEGKVEEGNVARALLWIEDIVIVEARQKNQQFYYIADAVSGAPITDAKMTFFGYQREWKDAGLFRKKPTYRYSFREFSEQPDADGSIVVTKGQMGDQYQWLRMAKDSRGRVAVQGFEGIYFSDYQPGENREARVYAVTDRPVYRPAQSVKWKAWVRAASYDPRADLNRWAGKSFEVFIQNPRGEKIWEQKLEADESGSVSGELSLAEDATLGGYSISISRRNDVSGQHYFRVEEYKKPEFEVKVEAPDKPVALGDAFEVKVNADYYFGGPVKEGKVKYKIERSVQRDRWFPGGRWDWLFGEGYGWRMTAYDWYPNSDHWCRCIAPWPWQPWRSDPPELIASGEKEIPADGTISIQVDTALALEMHGDQDHKYTITAEVTDKSRRTLFGSGSVLAARRPFEVYVWMNKGYYQSGQDGAIRLAAKTLDGRGVKSMGKIRVYRVTYADGVPMEKEVASFDAKTVDEGEVEQKIKWDRAGQYRVSAMMKDEAGHEIEGVAFVTVRGEDLNLGKDLRYDDIEVVIEKDEYSQGEEVEVLLHANRENARIALFIRAANGQYPDPVWVQMDGKSAIHRFTLTEKDQPNLFIEAFTVSDAKVHRATRQIVVPPTKRIATVELITDKKEYLPQQKPTVRLRVKDQNGQPFVGDLILTGYDKALEYISGGSNSGDIRNFFWAWKRQHNPNLRDSLHGTEAHLWKKGETTMGGLGMFGNTADELMLMAVTSMTSSGTMDMSSGRGFGAGGNSLVSKAPMAPVMPPPSEAVGGGLRALFKSGSASSVAAPAAAPAPPSGEAEGPAPMIRTNLADSAVWLANVKTDENGEAAFDFALPDNLTTWKIQSWVMGPQTQVGEAKVEIVTRKNLMVRLQAPRFFVEKDEVVISANVHNEMDKGQQVRAEIELEGGCLELLKGIEAKPTLAVDAHGEKRFDWRVKVIAPGEAMIRVKALAQDDSDAMEMKFPVYVHGALKTDSWSLALRPDQASTQIKMRVPSGRKPEATRLEVRWSPTLAMSLVDALPYLTDFPYGCTEQTLNRFVPTVITLGVLKDLGVDLKDVREKSVNLNAQEIGDASKRGKRWQGLNNKGKPKRPVFDEDEVKRMARAGLQRLEAMRNADGGWGWFPGGRESSTHITALVVHGLSVAEKTGVMGRGVESLMETGLSYLESHENEQLERLHLPKEKDHHKLAPDNLDALVHSALVEQNKGNDEMRERLFEHRLKLSRYNQAALGLACHAKGEKDRRNMVLRNLRQFLKEDAENQTAYLNLDGASWWYWYDDEIETQALFLKLLVVAEPKGELAPRVAKYLLNNRRNGTYWNSTKDTSAVIESLAAFVKASGESDPSALVEVWVDGQKKKEVAINRENLFTFDGTLVIEGDDLGSGDHVIEVKRAGKTPLYVNAYLTVFSKEDSIPAAGLEVKVRRAFYKLIEEKPDTHVSGARGQVVKQQGFKYSRVAIASDAEIKSGDLIEVELTVESKNDYEYLIIEDMKPAGYEPVEVRSGWNWEGLQSYQEFRDERVAFFVQRLPRGTHNLSYRVKAEIPGRFSALPAKIEAMYAPELKGNSDEFKARIIE